ncbi:MAG: M48 family metalloprotease, partial [Phycisphaerales bacterium]|nr:M48 family metalloprotease [Phycisphaerales bacterium]
MPAAGQAVLNSATPSSLNLEWWVGCLWLACVVALFARLALQWLHAWSLRHTGVDSAPLALQAEFDRLARAMGVAARSRLLVSARVHAPMVVGWLAPVVLIPASAMASLTPEQLRAVLVHELAHIRRYDPIVNALQAIAESLLFFHPVTWWLSRQIRHEREHCCDSIAAELTSPRELAEALAQLEADRLERRQNGQLQSLQRAALAATGGPLMDRIARIMGVSPPRRHGSRRLAIGAAAGCIIGAVGLAYAGNELSNGDKALEVLRKAALVGTPAEDLRSLYDLTVFPGSDLARETSEWLAKTEAELASAVDAGKLSRADADAKLAHVRDEIDDKIDMVFATDVMGLTEGEAYLQVVRKDLADEVSDGKLTQQQADAKLAEMERGIDLKKEYEREAKKAWQRIAKAIEAGEMTEEAGKARYMEFERSLGLRIRMREASQELDVLVEKGELSREDANAKLGEMRRMAVKHIDEAKRDEEKDWDGIMARLKAAVDSGDLTREQAADKLEAMKREAADKKDSKEVDWRGVIARLNAAVASGDLTREEAEAKLVELQQKMAEDSERGVDDPGDERRMVRERIARALLDAGIDREDIRAVMDVLPRIVEEIRREGRSFELDPR